MKYNFRHFALLIFIVAATSNSLTANKTEIRLILKKGQHFEYLVSGILKAVNKTGDKPIEVEQKMALTINVVVENKLRNGNYLIQADYTRFTLEVNSQGNIQKYDSNASNNQEWLNQLLKGMTKIHPKFEISSLGVVSNFTGFEEYRKDEDLNAELINFIKDFGTDRLISQMFNYIPKIKVESGDKWITASTVPEMNNLKYDINYTLTEASAENYKLDLQAKFKYVSGKPVIQNGKLLRVEQTGVEKGDVILDTKNYMPLSSSVNRGIDMLVFSKDTITNTEEVTQMKLSFKTSTKLVK